jgi:hypothetical protein
LFGAPDVGRMLAGRAGQTSLQAQVFRNHLTGVLRAVAYLREGAQPEPGPVVFDRAWACRLSCLAR